MPRRFDKNHPPARSRLVGPTGTAAITIGRGIGNPKQKNPARVCVAGRRSGGESRRGDGGGTRRSPPRKRAGLGRAAACFPRGAREPGLGGPGNSVVRYCR